MDHAQTAETISSFAPCGQIWKEDGFFVSHYGVFDPAASIEKEGNLTLNVVRESAEGSSKIGGDDGVCTAFALR